MATEPEIATGIAANFEVDLWDSNPLDACCSEITQVSPESLLAEFDPADPRHHDSAADGLGISPEIAWKLAFVASETARLRHPIALGWAGCTSTAISTTLALYFRRQRGLAITLALNGASAAGFTIGPLLVELSQKIGVGDAVPLAAVTALAVVLPLIWFGIKPAGTEVAEEAPVGQGAYFRAWGVERTWRFWSIALPFALVLAAQVGLIVHLVSFLLPRLGADGAAWALSLTSVAAVSGRLVLAGTIDRLHQRRAAAASFASQAVGLGLMLAFSSTPAALYGGCLLFGLSVGNVITFPALIAQREFPPSHFGRVIGRSTAISQFTFALAPSLLGVIRDSTGGYGAVLCLCMTLQLTATLLLLCGARDAA